MTIDWQAPPTSVPPRPNASTRRGRGRATRFRRWRGRRAIAVGAVAVTLGVAVAIGGTWIASAGRPDAGAPVSPDRASDRPTPPFRHLTWEWARDLPADPIEMHVSDLDTIVVTPFAVVSYATATGRVRWKADVENAEPYLAVNDSTVLVGALDGFVALERATGRPRWRTAMDVPSDRARGVVLVDAAGGPIAVGATELGGVVGLEVETGTARWSFVVDGSPRGSLAASVDQEGAVALVSDRGTHADLRLFDAATGAVQWSDTLAPRAGSPVIATDLVLIGSGDFDSPGTARAYRVRDGHLVWEIPTRAYFKVDPAPVVVDETVYLVDGVGNLMALDLRTGSRRWSRRILGVAFLLDLAVMDGSVFVTDILEKVHGFTTATGRRRGSWGWWGSPVQIGIGAGRIVVAQGQVEHPHVIGYVPHHMTDVERPENQAHIEGWIKRQEARRRAASGP